MDLSTLGIDPTRGGAALIVIGEVVANKTFTDPTTGEIKAMTEIGWWGGSSFFVGQPGTELSQVPEKSQVALLNPMTKGRQGWRPTGQPRLLSVGGKAITRPAPTRSA